MKKISNLLGIVIALVFLGSIFNVNPTYAEDSENSNYNSQSSDGCNSFLGLSAWYCHVDRDNWGGNTLEKPDKISKNVWMIATNVSNDIAIIAFYLVLGYTIYGGYLYMFSGGDTGKVATGKKTLTQAFIGLAIVMLAKVIVNTLHIALLGNNGSFSKDCTGLFNDSSRCIDPNTLVTNIIQWVIGSAGIVAAIFVVIGAISYITSSGDSTKLQKAKNTILYALIGLAIVGLAEIITAFVSSTIRNSNTSYITTSIIAKELTHEK